MKLLGIAFFALAVPAIAAAQNSGIFIQAGPLLDIRATSSTSIAQIPNDRNTYAWNDINGDRRWQPGEESVIPSDGLS